MCVVNKVCLNSFFQENEEVNVMFDYAKSFPCKNQQAMEQFEKSNFNIILNQITAMVVNSCLLLLLVPAKYLELPLTCSPRTYLLESRAILLLSLGIFAMASA